jgi:hypothetical protein
VTRGQGLLRLTPRVQLLPCWYPVAFATSIEPGQPAHPCTLTRLYIIGCPTSIFLDSDLYPKLIMENSKQREVGKAQLRNCGG